MKLKIKNEFKNIFINRNAIHKKIQLEIINKTQKKNIITYIDIINSSHCIREKNLYNQSYKFGSFILT